MRRPVLSRRARLGGAAIAALVAGTAAFGAGQATAEHSVPHTDKEIPNLTQVQDKIKAYYGDTVTADGQHYASPDSNYARQVHGTPTPPRGIPQSSTETGQPRPGYPSPPAQD